MKLPTTGRISYFFLQLRLLPHLISSQGRNASRCWSLMILSSNVTTAKRRNCLLSYMPISGINPEKLCLFTPGWFDGYSYIPVGFNNLSSSKQPLSANFREYRPSFQRLQKLERKPTGKNGYCRPAGQRV